MSLGELHCLGCGHPAHRHAPDGASCLMPLCDCDHFVAYLDDEDEAETAPVQELDFDDHA